MSAKTSAKSNTDTKTLISFEDSLAELEQIVSQLEAGERPLDESLALYEKGVAALKQCHLILDKAEKRIRRLVKGPDGEPVLQDDELSARTVPEDSIGQNIDAEPPSGQNPSLPTKKYSLRPSPQKAKSEEPRSKDGGSGAGGSLFGNPQ